MSETNFEYLSRLFGPPSRLFGTIKDHLGHEFGREAHLEKREIHNADRHLKKNREKCNFSNSNIDFTKFLQRNGEESP